MNGGSILQEPPLFSLSRTPDWAVSPSAVYLTAAAVLREERVDRVVGLEETASRPGRGGYAASGRRPSNSTGNWLQGAGPVGATTVISPERRDVNPSFTPPRRRAF